MISHLLHSFFFFFFTELEASIPQGACSIETPENLRAPPGTLTMQWHQGKSERGSGDRDGAPAVSGWPPSPSMCQGPLHIIAGLAAFHQEQPESPENPASENPALSTSLCRPQAPRAAGFQRRVSRNRFFCGPVFRSRMQSRVPLHGCIIWGRKWWLRVKIATKRKHCI